MKQYAGMVGEVGIALLLMAMILVAPHVPWEEARKWALIAALFGVGFQLLSAWL